MRIWRILPPVLGFLGGWNIIQYPVFGALCFIAAGFCIWRGHVLHRRETKRRFDTVLAEVGKINPEFAESVTKFLEEKKRG